MAVQVYSHPPHTLSLSKMATLQPSPLLFMLILLLFAPTRTSAQFCGKTSCAGLSIEFPFRLREANQSRRCGYPGFELSCKKKTQPLLTLPNLGDFLVTSISLEDQTVWINDPDKCLPRRVLQSSFSLEGSSFQIGDLYNLVDYSFFNCSSNVTESSSYPFRIQPISCLSTSNNDNFSVLAVLSNLPFPVPWNNSSCQPIASALVPVADTTRPRILWTDYYSDIQLQWSNPNCGDCEARGGRCGFSFGNTGPYDVACYNLPTQGQGLSTRAKYGIALGLGVPGVVGIMGLACIFWGKKKMQDQQRRGASTEFSTLIIPQPPLVVMGLDGATIEKYPKTQLGESGRLPKPNDTICSICLSEYQPKETLRTIPECNHYFHANCIDGWLKMNATCPLCRKLPERSSLFTSNLPLSPPSL